MPAEHRPVDSRLRSLTTEARNPSSFAIDAMSAEEIVALMNREDATVAAAVGTQADAIARGIEVIADRLRRGGRLVYIGAGTSGRLGVLDATECPPTFNTRPEQVVGLIAGGRDALVRAVEGAEDHPEFGESDLRQIRFSAADVLVGIATSGRTPYVLGAMRYARSIGAFAIGLSCNAESAMDDEADLMIAPVVGPEVISGSTRLKAGTATKLVLNMLTTGAMVLLGKTYGNLMVDLRATNEKLTDRSRRIVAAITGLSDEEALGALERAAGEVKVAIVAEQMGLAGDEARARLAAADGKLRLALEAAEAPRAPVVPSAVHAVEENIVVGVDGGGTKTEAWLHAADGEAATPRGRGLAGPSNIHTVGWDAAVRNIALAVQQARTACGRDRSLIHSLCVAVAGVGREPDRERMQQRLEALGLAKRVRVVTDAEALLAAGTPEGWGIATIAGTGSICVARTPSGTMMRSGGWGYLFSDEGSGYWLGIEALRTTVQREDGRECEGAILAEHVMRRVAVSEPAELLKALQCQGTPDRTAIAALAIDVNVAAGEGDLAAQRLLDRAAEELGRSVQAMASRFATGIGPIPFTLAGSLLTKSDMLQAKLIAWLLERSVPVAQPTVVIDPVRGAVRLATR